MLLLAGSLSLCRPRSLPARLDPLQSLPGQAASLSALCCNSWDSALASHARTQPDLLYLLKSAWVSVGITE